jgi:hypothetical protein
MPSPEQRGQSPPEQEPSALYIKAARFSDDALAGQIFFLAQETIFASPCDLSCYRLQLDQVSHVAVLGSQPPPEVDEHLTTLLATGELTSLPEDALAFLQARRAQARQIGSWVEGHYRPGKRFRRRS